MPRPVFAKLGGSVLTDKAKEGSLRKAVARRLVGELAKSKLPGVLFHGGGSFGHPPAGRGGIGDTPYTDHQRDAVSETLAAMWRLHAEILTMAHGAGLRPFPVPVHLMATGEAGMLEGLPVDRIEALLEEGFTPVLHGTVVRDDRTRWRIVSADELMAELARELAPRLAVFVTDVDGVLDAEGRAIAQVESVDDVLAGATRGADVTDGIAGKVRHGLTVAETCPTLVLNGLERGRFLDALKGKPVPGTRLVA